MKTAKQQLRTLGVSEFLIFLASFLFVGLDIYAQRYLAQDPEFEYPKQMSFLPLILGFVVLIVFFISIIVKVRSILQFSVVCVLTMVQLWLSFCFLSSGSYPFLEYSETSGIVYFAVLSGLHFYIAKRMMQALNAHEFVM